MSSHAGESSLSLAERYERLKVIVDISKRLSSNLDLQSLLRDIVSLANSKITLKSKGFERC